VSDADRERAIDVLKAAFPEGRLPREEHANASGAPRALLAGYRIRAKN
jgi:hypothetical protein